MGSTKQTIKQNILINIVEKTNDKTPKIPKRKRETTFYSLKTHPETVSPFRIPCSSVML